MATSFIVRGAVPVAVPEDYATWASHQTLVTALDRATRYLDAVKLLEGHPDSWLGVDVLRGAPWSQRYLRTTAHLWLTNRSMAQRGVRALMGVLNGTRTKRGPHRTPPLSGPALQHATDALQRWRTEVEAVWAFSRAAMVAALLARARATFPVSQAHQRALIALSRRPRVRRATVVLTLASWETGVAVRRLRAIPSVADLVYA